MFLAGPNAQLPHPVFAVARLPSPFSWRRKIQSIFPLQIFGEGGQAKRGRVRRDGAEGKRAEPPPTNFLKYPSHPKKFNL